MAQTDPPRQPPSLVWWMLGAVVIVAFVAVVMLLRGLSAPPHAVGPPAGTPAPDAPAQH